MLSALEVEKMVACVRKLHRDAERAHMLERKIHERVLKGNRCREGLVRFVNEAGARRECEKLKRAIDARGDAA